MDRVAALAKTERGCTALKDTFDMFRYAVLVCILSIAWLAHAAQAEVRFGGHVYIGGHNVSHQTFNRHRRGVFYLYNRQPHPAGCIWRRNGDGSRTKICRFQILH